MDSPEPTQNPQVLAAEASGNDARQAAAELPHQIASLQAVVNSLTVRAAEKSKPWYRQPSVIISVFALVFSLWNTYQDNRAKNHEEIQKKAEESQTIAFQIVDLHHELQDELNKPGLAPDQIQSNFAVFTNKRKLLLNKLLAMLQDKSVQVDPVVYLTLGDEAQFDSNPSDAMSYYDIALKSMLQSFGDKLRPVQTDQWTLDSVATLPVLPRAGLVYRQTLVSMAISTMTSHQLELGRAFYRAALKQLDNLGDVASKTNRYNILQTWAQAEETYGDAQSTADRVADMEQAVAGIPLLDLRRQTEMNLANFKSAIISTEEGRKGPVNTGAALLGPWRVSYPLIPDQHGDCFFTYQDFTHPPSAALSVLKGDHLLGTFTAGVYFIGAREIRVMWPSGIYDLTMSMSGKILSGKEYVANMQPNQVIFKKLDTNRLH